MAMTTERSPVEPPSSRFSLEVMACLGLFLAGLVTNLALVEAAKSQAWLTGEEASVAFKDVVFLPLRLQHCQYDTNLGGHLIFDLAFKLRLDPGLWYGRQAKALLMALALPLTFLLGRRLGLSVPASVLSGCALGLLPGFSSFSWLAMEAGLELLFGVLALHIALGRGGWSWAIAFPLLGLGLLVYGGAAAFVPPVLALVGLKLRRDPGFRNLAPAVVAFGLLAAVLSLPSHWWINTSHAYKGGGSFELRQAPFLFLRLLYELFYRPHSYYFFSRYPSLGGALFLPALAAGLYSSALKPRTWWPVWLVAGGSAALYCIAATPTGVRRSIPLTFVAALLLGQLFDWSLATRRLSKAAAWVLALAVILFLGHQTLATARAYRDGSIRLPHDFDWIENDMRMLLGQKDLDGHVRERVLALDSPIRAMCLLNLLNPELRPPSAPRFSIEDIREYYLSKDPERFK